jgi:hypothetical protein
MVGIACWLSVLLAACLLQLRSYWHRLFVVGLCTGRYMKRVKPEDKMFFHHLRYETFFGNMDRFQGVSMVRAEVRDGVRLLADSGVAFDVVFIDCEKKTEPLRELVRLIHGKWPGAVIVGDDYVFDSVKRAVGMLQRDGYRARTRGEAYLLFPQRGPFCGRDFEVDMDRAIDRHLRIKDSVCVCVSCDFLAGCGCPPP